MHNNQFIPILFGCLMVASSCLAHEDRIINMKPNGVLEGIPTEYGPGSLRIVFGSKKLHEPAVTSVILKLGKNEVRIPECVTGLLQTRRMSDIRVTASWYHNETLLPYYLHVDFFDPGYNKQSWANPGYSMIFNLHNARLIEMKIMVLRDEGNSIQDIPVDLSVKCKREGISDFADGKGKQERPNQ